MMSKSLNEVEKQVHVAEVVHHGEKLTIPVGMGVQDAIDLLERRRDYLSEKVIIRREFNVFPWDGANALAQALTNRFGWAAAESTPGFFGSQPPAMINIEVGPNQTKEIPWGRFSLPGIDGFVQTDSDRKDGRICFVTAAKIQRKDESVIKELFDDIANILKRGSIYAGKAIKIRFRDDDGDLIEMPEPKFLDTSSISRDMLVYSREVTEAIETNLFTPIERITDCIANDIPVKRGVLLGGPYGTGKTMAATVASRLATDNGVTYLYVPRSDELADAIEFAKQYQETACVIFCEDIDRAVSGERSVAMDDILNILDGIDTKANNIITVLTTNHLENINPAMLRPGRLDAIINVTPPDAEAVERLIRLYGKDTISADADLRPAADLLAGTIPAVIAEVVKRAKLVQLQLQEPGTKVENVSGTAVLLAAETMQSQIKLLAEQSKPKAKEPTFNEVMGHALSHALNGTKEQLGAMSKRVEELHDRVVN